MSNNRPTLIEYLRVFGFALAFAGFVYLLVSVAKKNGIKASDLGEGSGIGITTDGKLGLEVSPGLVITPDMEIKPGIGL